MSDKPTTVAELAAATKAVLVERGRCRGHFEEPNGSVCLVGAANVALGAGPNGNGLSDADWNVQWRTLRAIEAAAGTDASTAAWNDVTEDDADVFAVLDQIAATR